MSENFESIVEAQRRFFETGATRDPEFRVRALKSLLRVVGKREAEIIEATRLDLGKPAFESHAAEVGPVRAELAHVLKRVPRWSRPRRARTPLSLLPGCSRIYPEPYGVCLIVGTWNYPFGVAVHPLVNALGAGNCALVKPSEFAPATGALLGEIVAEALPPEHCAVIQGGAEEAAALLTHRFDFILFTGSARVGRLVQRAAARHLTPTVLELGGKSPCIVDRGVDLRLTARRICWGKFFNAGQTCTAPDYVLAPAAMKDALIDALKAAILEFYGPDPIQSPDYARIVNDGHFDRLRGLLDSGVVAHGGRSDRAARFIEPTILDDVPWDSPAMREEIFGPILPVLAYDDKEDLIRRLQAMERPLALYTFTRSRAWHEEFVRRLSFGGGCMNACLLHNANPFLPFGGVGESGMGRYHGRWGFETFSHLKGVLLKPQRLDMPLLYPPYGGKLGLLRRLM